MILLALLLTGIVGIASQLSVGRYFLERYAKAVFLITIVLVFVLDALRAFGQYKRWLADPLAKFLIPPYQDIGYFALYSFTHFFAPYLFSLLIALLFLAIILMINRKKGGIFFEREEPYLAALPLFLTGHPGWLIYLIVLLGIYLLLHLVNYLKGAAGDRLPLYHLWALTAFFVILLNEYWLAKTNWWTLLSF